jgi:hypothetical protein
MVPVNYLAIVASAILMMVIGYLWYGPLFGKRWTALLGLPSDAMSNARTTEAKISYLIMGLAALLMSFILAHAIIFANTYMQITGIVAGMLVGVMNWLGFVVPVSLGTVLWERKPWILWVINAGYYLVVLVIIGAVLAVWT